jgi:cell wall assembly regulator SMI1
LLFPGSALTLFADTEYVSSPNAYTYPPPAQGGSYDTVPQSYTPSSYDLRPPLSAGPSSASRSRPTSLLPIHHSPLSPLPNYPPLQQTWNRLRAWLDEQYPELADTLNWGIQPPDLAHLELQLGFALPPAVRDSYLIVDGQEAESSAGCSDGLFFGLTLLPFEDVVDEWRFWREVDDDPATGASAELREEMRSIPPGWIRREYSQRGWLPLIADKGGNYIGVDMNPDERGSVGQVIVFGRDFDTKVVMWRGDGEGGWARWLASFVDELESGEGFEVGGAEASEGSEDDVGYESYFFDGTVAKGQGGDGSGGGLRLTGEYRGWTFLEALADRSMRRWIEAGAMPQPTPVDEAGPVSFVYFTSRLVLSHISRRKLFNWLHWIQMLAPAVLSRRERNGSPSQRQTATLVRHIHTPPAYLSQSSQLLSPSNFPPKRISSHHPHIHQRRQQCTTWSRTKRWENRGCVK